MKICFVTTEFVSEPSDFDGGLANYIYKIAKALTNEGHEVLVLVQSTESKSFFYENIPVERVRVNINNNFVSFISRILNKGEYFEWIYSSFILNKRLRQLNKVKNFDIVQYSSFRATALFRPQNITCIVRLSSFHPYWNGVIDSELTDKTDIALSKLEQRAVKKSRCGI